MSVGKGRNPASPALAEVAGEAVRHLEWLRDAGVGEVPVPARTANPTATPSPAAAPSAHRPLARAAAGFANSEVGGSGPYTPDRIPTGNPTATFGGSGPSRYALADKGCGSPALLAIRDEVGECTRCKLAGGRTRLVFGVGNPRAELMFVGEGPGGDEDLQGEPFVGKAGQLLDKMIEAMGFSRAEVYIANVVKCRPPENRDPEPDEVAACEPFLEAQVAAVAPKVIVALGRFAVQTLLRDPTPIGRQRGRWREFQGVRCMPTFHPAYLLRSPGEKGKAWEDLKLVMREFGKDPARGKP